MAGCSGKASCDLRNRKLPFGIALRFLLSVTATAVTVSLGPKATTSVAPTAVERCTTWPGL